MAKKEIIVKLREVAGHKGVYNGDYQCPPHVWYYANFIMHWICKFCGDLRHKKPKSAYIDGENVTVKNVYI